MKIIYDDAAVGYGGGGHPERPERLLRTVPHLQKVFPQLVWERPFIAEDKELVRAHDPAHLARLRQPVDFDLDTPAYAEIGKVSPHFPCSVRQGIMPPEIKPWVSVT